MDDDRYGDRPPAALAFTPRALPGASREPAISCNPITTGIQLAAASVAHHAGEPDCHDDANARQAARHALARSLTYQRAELELAFEQLRLRNPDDPWLSRSDSTTASYQIATSSEAGSDLTSESADAVRTVLGFVGRAPG